MGTVIRANGSKRVVWNNPTNTPEEKAKYNGATWPENLAPGEELPSMAKQEFKVECDINTIVNSYMKTGDAALLQVAQKYYGDVSNLPTNYHESLNQIQTAAAAFDALPAKIRQKFNHDPGALLEFLKDPNNKDQAIELGLLETPPLAAGSPAPAAAGSPAPAGTEAGKAEPTK